MSAAIATAGTAVNVVLSLVVNAACWKIFLKTNSLVARAHSGREAISRLSKWLEGSQISNFVMRMLGEVAKFDPDLNEYEIETKAGQCADSEMPYATTAMKIDRTKIKPKSSVEPKKEEKKEEKKEPEKKEKKSEKDKVAGASGKDKFEKPADEAAKAGAKDPNYQTLCGLDNDNLFGPNKGEVKKKFKAPEKVEKADAKDPQYETLAGLDNNLFAGQQKEKKKEFKAPEKVEKADAKDPQYQTLADVNDNIFKK